MHRALCVSLAALLTVAPVARAQTAAPQGLRSQLEQLFVFGTCGEPLCLDVPGGHGSHFLPAVAAGQTNVVGFITESVARGAANIPISATSSGATYAIVGGLPVRTSTSAGPIFTERSQTLGRGRFFLGTNVSGVQYATLNGVPTDDLQFAFSHENVGDSLRGEPDWENDIIDMQMQLDVDLLVASVFATYGLTDFMDIGVAIPFVRVGVQGTSTAQVNAFGPGTPHYFAGDATNPVIRATSVVDATASGLGDVVGRVKVNLGQSRRLGASLLGEVRFATGDAEELLGAGSTNARAMAVLGAQFGAVAVRTNAGYVVRTGDLSTDAALVTLGIDNQMTSWATLAFDLISEWQVGESPLTLPQPIALDTPYVRILPATNIPYRREDRLDASLGVKFNVRGGTVLVVNGIVPLKQASLQPQYIWTVGLDFNF
jgi:hypothetical protein